MREDHEGEKFLRHEPCIKCGSSDANAVYENHRYCFNCEAREWQKNEPNHIAVSSTAYKRKITTSKELPLKGKYGAISKRRISEAICKQYKVRVSEDEGTHYYPYTDQACRVTAYKVRNVAEKTFHTEGSFKDTGLFGECLWSKGGKYITITEGEIDALSLAEVFNGKWAVCSLKNGASSVEKSIRGSYDFLDSFDYIVLAFDKDEAGKKAVDKAIEMFSPEKIKIMSYPEGYKDISDMLQAGLVKDIEQCFWNAKSWMPSDILGATQLKKTWLERPEKTSVSYPWKCLNQMTRGFRLGELVTITSGTGMGKSSVIRELEYHLLTQTPDKVGVIHLEETPERTIDGLVGLHLWTPYHLDEVRNEMPKEKASEAFDELFKRPDGNEALVLYDGKELSIEKIVSRIRLMAKAQDIKWVVLDHLNLVMSGDAGGDERRNIDSLMTKLREVVVETNIGLFVVSHLSRQQGTPHEEGGAISLNHLRGSQGIAQLSNIVIALERNQQSDDPLVRNTTTLRILKNRYTGETGVTGYLQYDNVTGRLHETTVMPEEM
jgi:twinkle protein